MRQSAPRPRRERTAASRKRVDRLFGELDDRALLVEGQTWRLEVYGICENDGHRWVQLAVNGPDKYMLTVAMTPTASADGVIQALSSWLVAPLNVHPFLRVA